MTTFVDTCALLAAINQTDPNHGWSCQKFDERRAEGPLIITDIVYSELSAGMKSKDHLDTVITEWALDRFQSKDTALFQAGQAFKDYCERRRKNPNATPRTNVLPDFLIGATAVDEGISLLTTNASDFKKYFPDIDIISP